MRRRSSAWYLSLVRELTLRTPPLDDVFLDLPGSHIESENAQEKLS